MKLLILNCIIPFVMVLVGCLLKIFPASDMRRGHGYHSPIARRSQTHWMYAQRIAPGIFITIGGLLFAAVLLWSALCLLLDVATAVSLGGGMVIGFGFLLFAFYKTDSQISREFPE